MKKIFFISLLIFGFSNTSFPDGSSFSVSYNTDNESLADNTIGQNVYAIINPGQFTGNVNFEVIFEVI